MGDVLAGRLKNSDRIILSQITSGSAIALSTVCSRSRTTRRASHSAALFLHGVHGLLEHIGHEQVVKT
jgi:hypothetical protein